MTTKGHCSFLFTIHPKNWLAAVVMQHYHNLICHEYTGCAKPKLYTLW
jgi:hypothetical protein